MHLLRSLMEYLVSCLLSTQGTCLLQGHMDHLDSEYFLCFSTLYINNVGDGKKLTVS